MTFFNKIFSKFVYYITQKSRQMLSQMKKKFRGTFKIWIWTKFAPMLTIWLLYRFISSVSYYTSFSSFLLQEHLDPWLFIIIDRLAASYTLYTILSWFNHLGLNHWETFQIESNVFKAIPVYIQNLYLWSDLVAILNSIKFVLFLGYFKTRQFSSTVNLVPKYFVAVFITPKPFLPIFSPGYTRVKYSTEQPIHSPEALPRNGTPHTITI